MRYSRRSIFVGVAIVSLNLLFLALLFVEFGRGYEVFAGSWTPNSMPTVGAASAKKPIDSYSGILVRPLFFKGRQPFVAPAPPPVQQVVVVAPPAVDPGFILGGVMIETSSRKAFISTRSNAAGSWASIGDRLMGWEVQSIEGNAVRLAQPGRTIEVQLFGQK